MLRLVVGLACLNIALDFALDAVKAAPPLDLPVLPWVLFSVVSALAWGWVSIHVWRVGV